MKLRHLATLSLLVILSLLGFAHSACNAQTSSTASDLIIDSEWIDLISAEGPVGIAKINKHVAHCSEVQLKAGSNGLIAFPGSGVIAALTKSKSYGDINLLSKQGFGDCEVQLEFLIGKHSNSGIKLQQRYEIQLYDSHDKATPTARECGGIYPHWLFRGAGRGLKYIDMGVPPLTNAAKPAGKWQTLKIVFKAPRFDKEGKKNANAQFVSVVMNGQTIHSHVEVDSPTGNASTPLPEVAEAKLLFQLDHGAVAFRNIRVRPLNL